MCTGAFILGEAGLLDGRRATTHWFHARALKQRFPAAQVEEDRIFITDGPIWTSAGMSAGLDLALGLIENDFGAELSRAVARKLVVYHRRGGGQSQHSVLLELDARSDRIQNALTFARGNLRATLSVEELAQAAHLSTRQFSRAFREETGQSPAKAVESLRVEAARVLIEQSRYTMDEVAAETGFVDTERMRRAFLRAFGQPRSPCGATRGRGGLSSSLRGPVRSRAMPGCRCPTRKGPHGGRTLQDETGSDAVPEPLVAHFSCRNVSRSWLTLSLWVSVRPCGAPG